MDTRQLIFVVLRAALGLVIWGGIVHSIFVGVRYRFRFPRILDFMAAGLIILEAVVLAAFPVPLAGATILLASLLVLFPLSPHIGWVLVGGPVRLRR